MNRKLFASVVAVLICISLISSGYSAWLILNVEGGSASPQFQVNTVQVNELVFEAVVLGEGSDGTKAPIELGKPADAPTPTYAWATMEGTEDLNFTLQITLKPQGKAWSNWKKQAVTFRFWLTDFAAGSDTNGTYVGLPLGSDNYIDITCSASGACTIAKTGLNKNNTVTISNGVITIPLSLAWGSAFYLSAEQKNVNPYIYFNSQSSYNDNSNTGFAKKAKALAAIKTFSLTVNGAWYGV